MYYIVQYSSANHCSNSQNFYKFLTMDLKFLLRKFVSALEHFVSFDLNTGSRFEIVIVSNFFKSTGLYYKHISIVNDAFKVINDWCNSKEHHPKSIIDTYSKGYSRFIVQALLTIITYDHHLISSQYVYSTSQRGQCYKTSFLCHLLLGKINQVLKASLIISKSLAIDWVTVKCSTEKVSSLL